MSSADDQEPRRIGEPWSPFPVQDWSALPADPLAPSAVDPTWGPPQPARRWWTPLLVLTVIALVLSGSTYVATSGGSDDQDRGALAFLPADGTASFARVESTRELKTTIRNEITESARLSGYTAMLSTELHVRGQGLDRRCSATPVTCRSGGPPRAC